MARTSWEQKYAGAKPPHVAVLEKPFAGLAAGNHLFIAAPPLIEARVRAVPRGATQTVLALRAALAREHGADATCPTSTRIFLRIVAERALERMAIGDPDPAPFWRVIDPDSPLAGKLTCGRVFVEARRAEEAQPRRRRTAASPSSPAPNSVSAIGSGTSRSCGT